MAEQLNLLVLHKGGIGDVVFALPFFADLKAGYPGSHLTVLTHDQGRELLAFAPAVDEALPLGPVSLGWQVDRARELIAGMRFDIALTTARSPRAAYFLWKSGAKTRVGFEGGPESLLYTHRAPVSPPEKVFSTRFDRLLRALKVKVSESTPRLALPAFARERGRAMLKALGWTADDGPLVGIHVGGGWPTKRWPPEHIAELARRLKESWKATLLLQGGSDDANRAAHVQALSPAGSVLMATGTTIQDALVQASMCDVAVGVDSGLSHATAALGIPTVYLFGPNDPDSIRWAPHQAVLRVGLECQPCNRAGKERCPLEHHQCMRGMLPERVAAALTPLLMLARPIEP